MRNTSFVCAGLSS
jgi:hypothetical protein